jgi:DNA-binding NarL/FixJ family response regulator
MENGLSDKRKKHTVPLIEKSNLLYDVIRSFLARAGIINVIHCNNFKDAVHKIKHHSVTLIITDTSKEPGGDSRDASITDFLHHVRVDKNNTDIPFILISDSFEKQAVEKALSYGHTQYLVKPFNEHLFHEKLDIALGDSEASEKVNSTAKKGKREVIALCENGFLDHLEEDVEFPLSLSHSFEQTIAGLEENSGKGLLILDESFAKTHAEEMKTLLSLKASNKLEVIILLDDMSKEHVANLHSIGIHYMVEKQHAPFYLQQLVPLLT